MLVKGKAPKVPAAAQAGAGRRHFRGEMVARPRNKARKGNLKRGKVDGVCAG